MTGLPYDALVFLLLSSLPSFTSRRQTTGWEMSLFYRSFNVSAASCRLRSTHVPPPSCVCEVFLQMTYRRFTFYVRLYFFLLFCVQSSDRIGT